MTEWSDLAAGVRAGKVSADTLSAWLCAQPALWFVVEGEFDADQHPVNVRPIVTHHASGATVSLLFTDEERARRYRDGRDEAVSALGVVAASPADGFEALLTLPIDGITINAGESDRLNAGRRQLESLAQLAIRNASQMT